MENIVKSGASCCPSCSHGACHEDVGHEAHGHSHKAKREWLLLFLGALLFTAGLWLPGALGTAAFFVCVLLCGGGIFKRVYLTFKDRQHFLDENFLMFVAIAGAFLIKEFAEGAAVLLLFNLGELLQEKALSASRRSIRSLMDNRFRRANRREGDRIIPLDAAEVLVGDRLVVMVGDGVAVDGVLLDESAVMDTSALTGESLPRRFEKGDMLLSGYVCSDHPVEMEARRSYDQSAASLIAKMVEEAGGKKSKSERFITRFARVYTPAVVVCAMALALLGPLLLGGSFSTWAYRALSLLVISCPCALVISVPTAFFAGIGAASKSGMLIKGGGVLERLDRIDILALDKTGTVTTGGFKVREVIPAPGFDEEGLWRLALAAEGRSAHPLARAITAGRPIPDGADGHRERAGLGVEAMFEGQRLLAGSTSLLDFHGVKGAVEQESTAVHIAIGDRYAGVILLEDELKPDANDTLSDVKTLTGAKTYMFTGDAAGAARGAANRLPIDGFKAGLLPADKVTAVEELMAGKKGDGALVYLGDGINDAPVLARADVGIAVSGPGGDAAASAADAVLIAGSLGALSSAVRIARRTKGIVTQNIVLSIGIKLAVMALLAVGFASMWGAVFADVGVALFAVMNSMRAMRRPQTVKK